MQGNHKFNYGYWRTDKPNEEGFSHELISSDTEKILNQTDLDTLEALPFPGVDTLLKAFRRNVERIPNHDMMGTQVDGVYKWTSWAQAEERSKHISYGMRALDLAPDISAEDQVYRFIGIQSKNREDWVITHLANIHQSITTVAFFDTLGPDAQKFIIN